MKKLFLFLLPLTVCTSSLFAEIVILNGLYYSLGTTTATVAADQSSDKSVYSVGEPIAFTTDPMEFINWLKY